MDELRPFDKIRLISLTFSIIFLNNINMTLVWSIRWSEVSISPSFRGGQTQAIWSVRLLSHCFISMQIPFSKKHKLRFTSFDLLPLNFNSLCIFFSSPRRLSISVLCRIVSFLKLKPFGNIDMNAIQNQNAFRVVKWKISRRVAFKCKHYFQIQIDQQIRMKRIGHVFIREFVRLNAW